MKKTTTSEDKPHSTYDSDALSKVTVFSIADSETKIISPLATFIMEQAQNEPKTLATLQKSYEEKSEIRVTLPDLFTYCQLLERRKLVKISVEDESKVEKETPMDQDLKPQEAETQIDLPETAVKALDLAKLAVYERKVSKLIAYKSQLTSEESSEEWQSALTAYFTRMLNDVHTDLSKSNEEYLFKLKEKLESILNGDINVNSIDEMATFIMALKNSVSSENLYSSMFDDLIKLFCELIVDHLSSKVLDDDLKRHKESVERIQKKKPNLADVEHLLFIKDSLKLHDETIDLTGELCRVYVTLTMAAENSVNAENEQLMSVLNLSSERINKSVEKINYGNQKLKRLQPSLGKVSKVLSNMKRLRKYCIETILNLFKSKTEETQEKTEIRTIDIQKYRNLSVKLGLSTCVMDYLSEKYKHKNEENSQFNGISAKWNLTHTLSNDDIDSLMQIVDRQELKTMICIVKVIDIIIKESFSYEQVKNLVVQLKTDNAFLTTIINKLQSLLESKSNSILSEIEQLWLIDNEKKEEKDRSVQFNRFRARLAGSLIKSTINTLEKQAQQKLDERQKSQIRDSIQIVREMKLTTRTELQKLISITDSIEVKRTADIFIAAELTRLFLLIDDAISNEQTGANPEFRQALTVTRKVFSDYLSTVNKSELPNHLHLTYEKMVTIEQTIGFYLTLETFKVAVLLEHLEHIIVN